MGFMFMNDTYWKKWRRKKMYNKINLTPAMLAGLARNAKGQISCIFLHWSAGYYGQSFKDYHLCIDGDGKVYSMCFNLTDKKAHTWHRNTGSVGIAMNCCWGGQAFVAKATKRKTQSVFLRYQVTGIRDQGTTPLRHSVPALPKGRAKSMLPPGAIIHPHRNRL